MTATLSQQLGQFAGDLRMDHLPSEVIESIQQRILDTVGIQVAGYHSDAGAAVRGLAEELGGNPQATVIGSSAPMPAAVAALVNGTYAHALDFDDTHLPSVVHPSAALVPAVLAAAEAVGATGSDVIVALAVGYEVEVRLAMAQFDRELRNSVFFEHGLHATSILGAVAGAVACARLRGLDDEGISNALGIACSMGAGIIEANRTGGTVKRFHCGWAAHSAVVAAAMAAHGLTAPPTVLEGRFGFFQAYCRERWNPDAVLDRLGERWETPGIVVKPYPCNHFTHCIVDATIALRERGLTPADVEAVTIGTASPSWRTIGDPIAEKRRPRTPYHAKFSAPFVFATALAGGGGLGVSFDDFDTESVADPVKRDLAGRCDVVVDEDCDQVFPHQFPAVVRVRTHRGSILEERVMVNRGGRDRPLSREDLLCKLRLTAGDGAEALSRVVGSLTEADSVSSLLQVSAVQGTKGRL